MWIPIEQKEYFKIGFTRGKSEDKLTKDTNNPDIGQTPVCF